MCLMCVNSGIDVPQHTHEDQRTTSVSVLTFYLKTGSFAVCFFSLWLAHKLPGVPCLCLLSPSRRNAGITDAPVLGIGTQVLKLVRPALLP